MSSIQKVAAFRTSDGSIFDTEQEAMLYENRAKYREAVAEELQSFYTEIAESAFTPRVWAISEKVVESFIMWQKMRAENPSAAKPAVRRKRAEAAE